jgi:hypothetical protein
LLVATAISLVCIVPAAWGLKVLGAGKGSKLGGYQTLVAKKKGHILLGLGLVHHGGSYRVCVDDPTGRTVCRHRRLKFSSPIGAFVSFIYWAQHFPVAGTGTYHVTWFKSGSRLGPQLKFIH